MRGFPTPRRPLTASPKTSTPPAPPAETDRAMGGVGSGAGGCRRIAGGPPIKGCEKKSEVEVVPVAPGFHAVRSQALRWSVLDVVRTVLRIKNPICSTAPFQAVRAHSTWIGGGGGGSPKRTPIFAGFRAGVAVDCPCVEPGLWCLGEWLLDGGGVWAVSVQVSDV